jgi:hypothetical protein
MQRSSQLGAACLFLRRRMPDPFGGIMFGKRVQLPTGELRDLYIEQGWTTTEIADHYGVGASTVRRALEAIGVDIRPRGPIGSRKLPHLELTESLLRDLYLEQKRSIPQIAELYGWGRETIRLRMLEYNIPIRSFSEKTRVQHGTHEEYKDFSGDAHEKAYLIGFRIGDLHVRREHAGSEGIRLACTSSKPEQIHLIEQLYGKYGHVTKNEEWRLSLRGLLRCVKISVSLNETFDFLLDHPTRISDWIFADPNLFLAFFGGFVDAEGSFHLKRRTNVVAQGRFSIKNTDKIVLEQCRERLLRLGIGCSNLSKVYDAGRQTSARGVFATKALWGFAVEEKESVLRLIELLAPYIHHAKRSDDMDRVRANVEWRSSKEFREEATRKRVEGVKKNIK